jgi:hypothetical protein
MIESSSRRWTRHVVARVVEKIHAYGVLWENLKERAHLEDFVDGRIILKCILQ